SGNLERYQRAHCQLARRPNTMSRLLLWLDRYPSLRARTLRCLASEPGLFSRLLAVHLGESSPEFLAATSLRLGWQFLTARIERVKDECVSKPPGSGLLFPGSGARDAVGAERSASACCAATTGR